MTLGRFSSSLLLLALACTGSPVGENGALGDAGGIGGAMYGPGPWGVLPTGYCCNSDEDCRYRTCLEVGGVKMCSDPCTSSDATCNSVPNFACDQAAGQCLPSGTPSCVPANQWAIGPRETGRCCPADFDGQTGKECQGNLCIAFGDLSNPYICTQPCDKSSQCPEQYYCNLATRFCWPYAEFYQCL